jgi:hypothetical protein
MTPGSLSPSNNFRGDLALKHRLEAVRNIQKTTVDLNDHTDSNSNFYNPNLIKSIKFNSPNSKPKDRFATTNIGYTTAIKFHPKDNYFRKAEEEKIHREKMRDIVLGHAFELGFDPKSNCPSNEQKDHLGKPMFEQVTTYTTKDCEENKSKIEKQNFTISTGIAGGKAAEQEVWMNPFEVTNRKNCTFTNGDTRKIEALKMRQSNVPFALNSPSRKF